MINNKIYKVFTFIMLVIIILNFSCAYADRKLAEQTALTISDNKAVKISQRIYGAVNAVVLVFSASTFT